MRVNVDLDLDISELRDELDIDNLETQIQDLENSIEDIKHEFPNEDRLVDIEETVTVLQRQINELAATIKPVLDLVNAIARLTSPPKGGQEPS